MEIDKLNVRFHRVKGHQVDNGSFLDLLNLEGLVLLMKKIQSSGVAGGMVVEEALAV